MNNKHIFNDNSNSDNIVSLTVLLKKLIAVSTEAKRVADAINKQKKTKLGNNKRRLKTYSIESLQRLNQKLNVQVGGELYQDSRLGFNHTRDLKLAQRELDHFAVFLPNSDNSLAGARDTGVLSLLTVSTNQIRATTTNQIALLFSS